MTGASDRAMLRDYLLAEQKSLFSHLKVVGHTLEPSLRLEYTLVAELEYLGGMIQRRHDALAAKCGIGVREMMTLYTIIAAQAEGSLTPQRLAERLALDSTVVSKRLARLEGIELISRRRVTSNDRRVIEIDVTPAGRKMYAKIRRLEQQEPYAFHWIAEQFGVGPAEQLVAGLRRLIAIWIAKVQQDAPPLPLSTDTFDL